MKNIDVFAACSDLGVHVNGSQLGPNVLINKINKKNIHNIKKINYDINFKKELDKNNKKKNLLAVNNFNKKLYFEIKNSLENNSLPITLGGDHSVAIASALASIQKYNNLGIIWFDAHGDFHTFETTISGNIHGLPLAVLANYEKTLLNEFHSGNYYSPKNTVILGARDIDEPDELQNLKDAGVTVITTADIRKYGMEAMAMKAFEIASADTYGVHISYDLDVIDPIIAPGVSIPAADGINLDEAYCFLNYIIKNKNIIKSLDIVELNPERDIDKKTENIALHILNKIIINFK